MLWRRLCGKLTTGKWPLGLCGAAACTHPPASTRPNVTRWNRWPWMTTSCPGIRPARPRSGLPGPGTGACSAAPGIGDPARGNRACSAPGIGDAARGNRACVCSGGTGEVARGDGEVVLTTGANLKPFTPRPSAAGAAPVPALIHRWGVAAILWKAGSGEQVLTITPGCGRAVCRGTVTPTGEATREAALCCRRTVTTRGLP